MNNRKRIVTLALTAILILSTAACGAGTDSPGEDAAATGQEAAPAASGDVRTITFATNNNDLIDGIGGIIADFEAENNAKVEIVSGFNGWPDFWTKLLTSIAGDTAPDAVLVKETYLSELYHRGAAYNIKPLIDSDPTVEPEDFVDAMWQTVALDENGVYGLPSLANIIVLFYNVDLLDEQGYTEPPQNWDELKEYAKALTIPEKEQYGFMWYELGTREPCFAWWLGYYWMAGGEVWANGEIGRDFNIDNEAGRKALGLQIDMIYGDQSALPPTVQATNLAENGKVAMWMQGSWQLGSYPKTMPDVNWDVALLPGDRNRAHNALVDSYAITAGSKHPELTYALIRELSSEENDIALSASIGHLPTRKTSFQQAPYTTDSRYQVMMDAFFLPETRPKPVCNGYEELGVAMATELQKAWFGQVTVEEALASADEKAAEILGRVNG